MCQVESVCELQADNITVPGIGGQQQIVVTSTGLNNETNLLGQDASDRVQSVSLVLHSRSACQPCRWCLNNRMAVRASSSQLCCPLQSSTRRPGQPASRAAGSVRARVSSAGSMQLKC